MKSALKSEDLPANCEIVFRSVYIDVNRQKANCRQLGSVFLANGQIQGENAFPTLKELQFEIGDYIVAKINKRND